MGDVYWVLVCDFLLVVMSCAGFRGEDHKFHIEGDCGCAFLIRETSWGLNCKIVEITGNKAYKSSYYEFP